MDFLPRKVLTETEYAAQKESLDPLTGYVIVSDGDPTQVVSFGVGTTTFATSSSGTAPGSSTYITNTDETADLPNSFNIGATNLTVGSQSILMNNPLVFNEGNLVANVLQSSDPGFLWVDNAGALNQTRNMNFTSTGGPQNITWSGVNVFQCEANAYAFNGNTVGSDTGFDGPTMTMNFIESNDDEIIFRRKVPSTPLKVTYRTDVEVDLQGNVYTNFTSGTGTHVVVGAANQLFLQTSSRRFKENITPIEITSELLTKIIRLEPVTYTYKPTDKAIELNGEDFCEKEKQKVTVGLIAEELYELFPNLVNLDEEGKPYSINYSGLTVILINAIKQLHKETSYLTDRLEAVENKLQELNLNKTN
jgi:hypothetical protein